jgi:predicted membrane protein
MSNMDTPSADDASPSTIHWPALSAALLIMLGGTVYPPLMADAAGRADHGLATALFMAMAAGFVRGVGFVPRFWLWRGLFSAWACAAALLLAGWLKWLH